VHATRGKIPVIGGREKEKAWKVLTTSGNCSHSTRETARWNPGRG